MKTILGIAVVIILALRAVGDDSTRLTMRFNRAPVEQVASFYSVLTGTKLEIEAGVSATVTLNTQEQVTEGEATRLIEEALRKQNVGIYRMNANVITVRWIDPAMRPQGSAPGLAWATSGVSDTTTNGPPRMSYKDRREERNRARLERNGLAKQTNAVHKAGMQEDPNQVPEDTAHKLADPQH